MPEESTAWNMLGPLSAKCARYTPHRVMQRSVAVSSGSGGIPQQLTERGNTMAGGKQQPTQEASGAQEAPAPGDMFLSAPTTADLRPSPADSRLIVELCEWQERSARSLRILGEPIGG